MSENSQLTLDQLGNLVLAAASHTEQPHLQDTAAAYAKAAVTRPELIAKTSATLQGSGGMTVLITVTFAPDEMKHIQLMCVLDRAPARHGQCVRSFGFQVTRKGYVPPPQSFEFSSFPSEALAQFHKRFAATALLILPQDTGV